DARHNNFHYLNHRVLELDNRRFLGTPLWFQHTLGAPKYAMNDFTQIYQFESWVYDENAKAKAFLHAEMRNDDIVMMHYLPTPQSIHPKYTGSKLNVFFVDDIESLIIEREPRLIQHGHTH